jgi:indolepyruvate ferredoxin oxidoreductase beta subunit
VIEEGIRRLVAYQGRGYASLYLDRLKGLPPEIVREVARHLAVRMSFEDVIRVAQAKTSRDRLERVRAEVRAKPNEPLEITEHFKPGNEEIAALLPPFAARWLLARRKFNVSMHVRSTTVLGFARLRLLAGLRWWRPHTWRYIEEQAEIERWLRQVRAAAARSVELAREIAELARLIKGYGDTARRGIASYRRIESEIIEPALAGTLTAKVAVDAIANARVAALGDPDGDALSRMLAALASTLAPMHRAAE